MTASLPQKAHQKQDCLRQVSLTRDPSQGLHAAKAWARMTRAKGLSDSKMATLMTETEHAAFIAEARLRLTTLKERAVKRARFRGDTVAPPADRDALAGQQPSGGLGERHSNAQSPAEARPAGAALQRLIAAMLLDAATVVPIDSAKLHREVRPVAMLQLLQASGRTTGCLHRVRILAGMVLL